MSSSGTILVTGASGSVGEALLRRLRGRRMAANDLEPSGAVGYLDVTDPDAVGQEVSSLRPSLVYHLAGAKHAPLGELDPAHVAEVNINGTLNVLDAARAYGARVVMASTCKACDPETAYGASKLIAERAVLNERGTVVRFHNIPESSGNVFRLWESLAEDEPLPVTDSWRYFVSMDDAVRLLLDAADLEPGRYAVAPAGPVWIPELARLLYGDRPQVRIDRRRGDREREPLVASCETFEEIGDGYLRIVGAHDPVPSVAEIAA